MIPQSKPTRFGLMRHATTLWNQQKRIQGKSNTPLVPEGKDQAAAWSDVLKSYSWHRILTSDLGRALQTTEIVNAALNLPVDRDPRLQEQDWGAWTGKSVLQIQAEDPESLAIQVAAGWQFRPPGGEVREAVYERSLQALLAASRRWPGKTILVVTHEGVIKSLLYRLHETSACDDESLKIQPYRLHWLVCDSRDVRIECANAVDLTLS